MLGGWLGSWALFAFVIAPTAFRVLPSGDVAGAPAAAHIYARYSLPAPPGSSVAADTLECADVAGGCA